MRRVAASVLIAAVSTGCAHDELIPDPQSPSVVSDSPYDGWLSTVKGADGYVQFQARFPKFDSQSAADFCASSLLKSIAPSQQKYVFSAELPLRTCNAS